MEIDQDIFASGTSTTSNELREISNKLGLECNIIDLSELASNPHFYAYVHTGQKPNEYNKGNTNHWCCIYGKQFFDSYGKYHIWQKPNTYEDVDTVPKQLQALDTNVCGAYCAAFIDFCNKKGSDGSEDLGREFCLEYDFGKNRKQNDTIILSWYDRIMG